MTTRISSLNLRYINANEEGQTGNFYDHNYDQRNYQNRYRSHSGDRRISFSGRIQYRQNYLNRPRYNQNYRGDLKRGSFRGNLQSNQNNQGQNYRGGYRRDYRKIITKVAEVSLGIYDIQIIPEGMRKVVVGVDQVQELVPIEKELDAINIENMIILLKIVQIQK